jgi:Mce-associated membrane protein
MSPTRLGLVAGICLVTVLLVLCGWLGYRVNQDSQENRLRATLIQVAKQGAVNLTTIDYLNAESDVQRIIDSATGEFAEDFRARSTPFIDVVKRAKSQSVGTVTEAGLESVSGQQGRVLVSVTVKTVSDGRAEEQPRYWRMRMTVSQQTDGAKVADVEFVP